MRLLSRRHAGLFVFLCAVQVGLASPAEASRLPLVNSQMLLFLQTVSGPNLCISYSYDRNGNVLVKSNSSYGAQATWGSSVYGCFKWTSS